TAQQAARMGDGTRESAAGQSGRAHRSRYSANLARIFEPQRGRNGRCAWTDFQRVSTATRSLLSHAAWHLLCLEPGWRIGLERGRCPRPNLAPPDTFLVPPIRAPRMIFPN